jgi:hypothetical protein
MTKWTNLKGSFWQGLVPLWTIAFRPKNNAGLDKFLCGMAEPTILPMHTRRTTFASSDPEVC